MKNIRRHEHQYQNGWGRAAVLKLLFTGMIVLTGIACADTVMKPATIYGIRAEDVAFSPDGLSFLVAGPDNHAVLRSVSGEGVIQIFTGHSGKVTSVAFSQDGLEVLTGSADNTAKLWDASTGDLLRTFTGHTGAVNDVAFSGDGTEVFTGSADNTAKLWNKSTGAVIATFTGHTDEVTAVAFSPSMEWLLTGSKDDTVKVWFKATSVLYRTFSEHGADVTSVAFAPDSYHVLSGAADGTMNLHTLWGYQRTFTNDTAAVTSVSFSADGTKLLSGSAGGMIKMWDTEGLSYHPRIVFAGHTDEVTSVAVSQDGARLLSASKDGTVKLWDSADVPVVGEQFLTIASNASSTTYSPDGNHVLVGYKGGAVRLWDAETGELVRTYASHSRKVTSLAFSSDGAKIITGSLDKTVQLFDKATAVLIHTYSFPGKVHSLDFSPDDSQMLVGLERYYVGISNFNPGALLVDMNTGELIRRFKEGQKGSVTTAAFSPDGTKVLTRADNEISMYSLLTDATAKLWDKETGEAIHTFDYADRGVICAAFSPDGTKILIGASTEESGTSGLVDMRDTNTGERIRTFNGIGANVQSVAFSSDGTKVIAGGIDGETRLWTTSNGNGLFSISCGNTYSAAFSPDSTKALTLLDDEKVKLWDISSLVIRQRHTFTGHTDCVKSVAFSPDSTKVLTGSFDNRVKLRNRTGGLIRSFSGHTDKVYSVAYSPDSTQILTGSGDNTAKLWDADTGEEIHTFSGHTGKVYSVAFSPGGAQVLTGSADSTVKLWNANTGAEIRTFSGHMDAVWGVAFSPDGSQILTGSQDNTAILWNKSAGTITRTFTHASEVLSVAFSPDGAEVLTGTTNNKARLWNASTGAAIRSFSGHTGTVCSVAFSPNGKKVLTGSIDNTAGVWNADTGDLLHMLIHTDDVYSVAYSPDGSWILTGCRDNTAELWGADTGTCIDDFPGHADYVTSVAFAPDGAQVLTGSRDKTAKLWHRAQDTVIHEFSGHTGGVTSVTFSADGSEVATGSEDKTAKLWNISTGAITQTYAAHSDAVTSLDISPDGVRLLTGSADNTAILWNKETGALLRTFFGHTDDVTSVKFSPDGTQALTGSADNTAILWNRSTGAVLRTFSGHTAEVTSVDFSSDNTMVLTGSADNTARLWDASTGGLLHTFTGHTQPVSSVTFSSDDAKVLTGSHDGTMKFWSVATGLQLRTFTGHTQPVSSVDFSPVDAQVLSGSYDNTAMLWDTVTAPWVAGLSPCEGDTISTSSVGIYVTFSKEVTGVDEDDMDLSGAAAASATVSGWDLGGRTWYFAISGLANGALDIDLAPDANDIEDLSGNDLTPAPTSWSYTVSITGVNYAQARNKTTVRVGFNEAMADNAALIDPANYTFSGGGTALTAASVTRVDSMTVDVTVNEMTSGATYTIYVETNSAGPTDLEGNHLGSDYNSKSFTGKGVGPIVSDFSPAPESTIFSSSVDIDVTFSEPVTGVDVSDMVLSGVAFGPLTTVDAPTNQGGNTWRFPVSGLQNGVLNISLAPDADDIEDLSGNDLDPSPTTWCYTVSATKLKYASERTSTRVRLVFNRPMTNDTALVNPDNYTFTGGGVTLTATEVEVVYPARIVVTVNEMTDGAAYTAHVETGPTGPTDSEGHHVDPLYSSGDFTGIGIAPTVLEISPASGATIFTSTADIDVTFSEAVNGVDTTNLLPTSMGVSVGTPVDLGNNAWRFPVSGLANGLNMFTLTSATDDIEDLAGNDLVPDSASWNYTVVLDSTPPTPTVTLQTASRTSADAIQFGVTFDEQVAPTFDPDAVSLTGDLNGTVAVSGTDPVYTVTVTLEAPGADGTVGIVVGDSGAITDLAGNPYTGSASSPLCEVLNWHGFTEQPQGARIYSGDAHTFTVTPNCDGDTFWYQWKWDDGSKTIHDIGSDSSTCMLPDVAGLAGDYWCEVTYDGSTYQSNAATLEVAERLLITEQPTGGICTAGTSCTFNVTATGGYLPLSYTWKRDGVIVLETTEAAFTLDVLTEEDAGEYTAEIWDDNSDMAVSDAAELVIKQGMPASSSLMLLILTLLLTSIGTIILYRRHSQHHRSTQATGEAWRRH